MKQKCCVTSGWRKFLALVHKGRADSGKETSKAVETNWIHFKGDTKRGGDESGEPGDHGQWFSFSVWKGANWEFSELSSSEQKWNEMRKLLQSKPSETVLKAAGIDGPSEQKWYQMRKVLQCNPNKTELRGTGIDGPKMKDSKSLWPRQWQLRNRATSDNSEPSNMTWSTTAKF